MMCFNSNFKKKQYPLKTTNNYSWVNPIPKVPGKIHHNIGKIGAICDIHAPWKLVTHAEMTRL